VQKYNLTIVPQVVIWGEEVYEDGISITPSEFYTRLQTDKIMPKTSQVSIVNMHKAFSTLIDQGYEVFGMFLSEKLSGTINSAVQGREQLGAAAEKVTIFDTYTTSMAMGFQVTAVARAAAEGASIADCKALAEKARESVGVFLVVDTLEFLHRNGRIGGAQRFLGSALNLKPLLTVEGGRVEPVERVRSKNKAHDRMLEIVLEKCQGKSPVRVAGLHANAEDDAKAVLDRAIKALNPVESALSQVGPAVGANTGPGTVGLAYMVGM
jgi:DegV family protein with EDD domain